MNQKQESFPANDNRFTDEQMAKIQMMLNLPVLRTSLKEAGLDEGQFESFIRDAYYSAITQNSDLAALKEKYPMVSEVAMQALQKVIIEHNGEPTPPTPTGGMGVVLPFKRQQMQKAPESPVQNEPPQDQIAA